MQKLILPINNMRITASYKAAAYKNRFGFTHYGFDAIALNGSTVVYASGGGKVLLVGNDSVVGNVVIVCYSDALNHKTGKSADIIMRYFHLKQMGVKVGDTVYKDTKIGDYGNTGRYSTGAHLHFEFDSDITAPLYTSTLGGNSSLLRAAKFDSSVDPTELLHVKSSAPDCQQLSIDSSRYRGNPYVLAACGQLPDWETN